MEGLLPMVYKSIKKSRTRRHYEFLSSGTSQSYNNAADFYVNEYSKQFVMTPPGKITNEGNFTEGKGHRRSKSLHANGFSPENAAKSGKLVRFRSHRFFSCVTG